MPWFRCSAILDPITLVEVRDLSGFDPSIRIQHTSIDRPNIRFTIQPIQYLMNSYHDLEFLIELVQTAVEQVIKERTENMVREILKNGSKVTAKAVLADARHQ